MTCAKLYYGFLHGIQLKIKWIFCKINSICDIVMHACVLMSHELHGISNHQHLKCSTLLALCEGNPPGFPSQMASNVESLPMSWHLYVMQNYIMTFLTGYWKQNGNFAGLTCICDIIKHTHHLPPNSNSLLPPMQHASIWVSGPNAW